jgi:predicted phage tail protein
VELELLEPARFTPTRNPGWAADRRPYRRPKTVYSPRRATTRLGRRTRRRRVSPYLLVAVALAALAVLGGVALAVVWFVHWIAAHAAVIIGLLAMAGIGLVLASGGAGGCCVDLIKRCGH